MFRNNDKEVLNVGFASISGKLETLGVTAEHPFWAEGKGWTNAGDLNVGDEITTLENGVVKVATIASDAKTHTTYNFEVEDFHTYFVGEFALWVHNTCSHVINRSVEKAFNKNSRLKKAFDKAIGNGLVGSTGQSGIKGLKGNKKFTHEVKFLSKEFGDVRVFGNKLADGTFEWIKVGSHKTL